MKNEPLPNGLKQDLHRIQDGIKQWSQFVAWSWTNYLAFKDTENQPQEEKLKKFFRKILQDQARYSYAVNSYGDETRKRDAYTASFKIKKLLLGQNREIDELRGVTLTCPEVYEQLTAQQPESLSDEIFMKRFHLEVVTDRFSGSARELSDAEKAEIKEFLGDENLEYIVYLAYPPCPKFGEATITEQQLELWMTGRNEYGESTADYLPPSAYIPICFS
ncbi:MAG: hypothetical protein SAL07_01420 [Oscillatoria sp. PMC 1051.18]|nr:hypothetical protein [Oscillatoria sp. PMC 1050.18]MEC5028543.1 hypothetical protein [Oscillatoria sp. PMC 1051.18]